MAARLEGGSARVDPGDARLRKAWSAAALPCDEAMNRATATVALRFLAAVDPSTDFDTWWHALEQADRLLGHAAACSPNDGNAWANLALVRRAVVVPASDLSALIHLSERLSPSEIAAVRTRLEIWRGAPDAVRALIADVARRDAARVRSYGRPEDADGLAAP